MPTIPFDPKRGLIRPSFCDIQLNFWAAIPASSPLTPGVVDLRRISYGEDLSTDFLMGSGDTPLARTTRTIKSTADLEVGIETGEALLAAIASPQTGGYGDASFSVTVTYQLRPGANVLRDELIGCKVIGTSTETDARSGASVTMNISLSVARVQRNGSLITQAVNLAP